MTYVFPVFITLRFLVVCEIFFEWKREVHLAGWPRPFTQLSALYKQAGGQNGGIFLKKIHIELDFLLMVVVIR